MKRALTLLICTLCLSFSSQYAKAQYTCAATISATDSIINGVDTYVFTAVGTFNPVGDIFLWSFGDGTGHYGQTVTHAYNAGANMFYSVQLTVSDTIMGCTATYFDTIFPRGTVSPCSSYFAYTNVDSLFTLSTINVGVPPYTYLWTMPDSTTSTLPDPTYTVYDSVGYPGTVIVTDSTGCADTLSWYVSLANTVNNNQPCQAYFYVVPDSASGGYAAVDCSTGSGLSYLWSFGDGDTSSLHYPTHTYAAPGYYTVCLTVSSVFCTSSFCDSSFYARKTGGGPMSSLVVVSRATAAGVNDLKADAGISIYPNPANSTLAIRVIGTNRIEKSTIYNTNGQKVAEFSSTALLSVSHLPAAVYLLEVKTTNGIYRTNFVKQE